MNIVNYQDTNTNNNLYHIAINIAKEHIDPHNAKFELIVANKDQGIYFAIITHPLLSSKIEEAINTNKMPPTIAEEYMHCRIHGLAAKLISKLHPEKP